MTAQRIRRPMPAGHVPAWLQGPVLGLGPRLWASAGVTSGALVQHDPNVWNEGSGWDGVVVVMTKRASAVCRTIHCVPPLPAPHHGPSLNARCRIVHVPQPSQRTNAKMHSSSAARTSCRYIACSSFALRFGLALWAFSSFCVLPGGSVNKSGSIRETKSARVCSDPGSGCVLADLTFSVPLSEIQTLHPTLKLTLMGLWGSPRTMPHAVPQHHHCGPSSLHWYISLVHPIPVPTSTLPYLTGTRVAFHALGKCCVRLDV